MLELHGKESPDSRQLLESASLLPTAGYSSSDLGQIKTTWTAPTLGAKSFFPTAQVAAPHSGIRYHYNTDMEWL